MCPCARHTNPCLVLVEPRKTRTDITETNISPMLMSFYLYIVCYRQWLPRNKLEPLGVDSGLDKGKLLENKKPNVRKAVQKAYEKAILHRCSVTGEPNPLSGDSSSED